MTIASVSSAPAATLAGVVWPVAGGSGLRGVVRGLVLMLLGTVALWLSAKIQVPLWPVPMTMQTFVVLTLGIAYGWRLAGATLLLYLAEGAAGLPVFAGPAPLVGRLAERGWDRNPATAAAAMAIGNLVIYALGLAWLSTMMGFLPAVEAGLLPFLLGDAIKVALGAALLPLAWAALNRRQR